MEREDRVVFVRPEVQGREIYLGDDLTLEAHLVGDDIRIALCEQPGSGRRLLVRRVGRTPPSGCRRLPGGSARTSRGAIIHDHSDHP